MSNKYAHAGDYNEKWINPSIPEGFGKWYGQLCVFLVHLSYNRRIMPHKKYPVFDFYPHFRNVIIDFLKELPDLYKTEKLNNLLKDLEQELKNNP